MTENDARPPAKRIAAKAVQGQKPAEGAKPGRAGQRSRLLNAIVQVVARDGYSQAKIGELAAHAGVSRATFYEIFDDKEECFLAAYQALAERLNADVSDARSDSEPTGATEATLTALVSFADREPAAFNLLTHEAMLAGPRAMDERERLIAGIAGELEHSWGRVPGDVATPDLPAQILLGGVIRALGIRIRRHQDSPMQLLGELLEWIDSYSVSDQARRWRGVTPHATLSRAEEDTESGPMAPAPLPRGRHRLPGPVVKRVQRERILHATVEAIATKGAANVTVADIVATAGLSREVFYAHFQDKQEALEETFKMVFEQIMVVSVGAFFGSTGAWPEQVWEAGRAFTRFLVSAPGFAHFAFVESYALGAVGAQRIDELILGFTLFLEDGYRYRPEAARVPRLASEAIAGAVMDTATFFIRHERAGELPALLPLTGYMILAPFMGNEAACEFVDAKTKAAQADGAVD